MSENVKRSELAATSGNGAGEANPLTAAWCEDPGARNILRRFGYDSVKSFMIAVSDIMSDDGFLANWRSEGVSNSDIVEYAENMEKGDTFPEIVVCMIGNGKYALLGGLHRLKACLQIKRPSVRAIVLPKMSNTDMALLRIALNQPNGRRNYREHQYQYAAALVRENGLSHEEVRRALNLSLSTLRKYIKIADIRDDARRHKIDVTKANDEVVFAVSSIKDVDLRMETLENLVRLRVTNVEANELVKQMKSISTEDAALILEEFVNRKKTRKPSRQRTDAELLINYAKYLLNVMKRNKANVEGAFNDKEGEQFNSVWKELQEVAEDFIPELRYMLKKSKKED